MKTLSTADLATKTCKRGHTGHYFLRKDGSSACKVCTRGSMAKYRGVEEAKLARLKESAQARFAELSLAIPKLKLELELSETEYEFLTKQLAILGITK